MSIELLTYTKVDVGWPVPALVLAEHDERLDTYLDDVLAGLLKDAEHSDNLPDFETGGAAPVFRHLRDGSTAEFLVRSRALATQLVGVMNGRTKVGLFACLRARVDGRPVAAALKLQVASAFGARLEAVANGELKLSAVTDVLTSPGNLQKGAVLVGAGSEERWILGDKLREDALYFPRALGIRPQERTGQTARRLIAEINRTAPDVAVAAARVLPTIPPGPVVRVLEELGEQGVVLTAEQRTAVVEELGSSTRPVTTVATGSPITTTYDLDGVTVTVKQGHEDRVSIEATDDGYRVVATTTTRPEPRFSAS